MKESGRRRKEEGGDALGVEQAVGSRPPPPMGQPRELGDSSCCSCLGWDTPTHSRKESPQGEAGLEAVTETAEAMGSQGAEGAKGQQGDPSNKGTGEQARPASRCRV